MQIPRLHPNESKTDSLGTPGGGANIGAQRMALLWHRCTILEKGIHGLIELMWSFEIWIVPAFINRH